MIFLFFQVMRSSGKLVTDEDMRANKIRGPECLNGVSSRVQG